MNTLYTHLNSLSLKALMPPAPLAAPPAPLFLIVERLVLRTVRKSVSQKLKIKANLGYVYSYMEKYI